MTTRASARRDDPRARTAWTSRSVGLHVVPTDRVWTRDSGPTGVLDDAGALRWVAWRFNAWAKYDDHARDEHVAAAIARLSGVRRRARDARRRRAARARGRRHRDRWRGHDARHRGVAPLRRAGAQSRAGPRRLRARLRASGSASAARSGSAKAAWATTRTATWTTSRASPTRAPWRSPTRRIRRDENHARSADNLRRLELAARTALRVVKLPYPRAVDDGRRAAPGELRELLHRERRRASCRRSTTRTTASR